ncbi:MAG: DNA methylase [Blautia sp.]|nr:DNA methylase [Blautia sp.]
MRSEELLSSANCFIAVDMKSFYASCEAVARNLDPLKVNLLVADSSRSDKTICLAVSPSLKAIGVPSRPRLFEAKQAIREYEIRHHTKVEYITATPRMKLYENVSARIYSILLHYVAPEDIHVYSIDESFLYVTPYLHKYQEEARKSGQHPAHVMAMAMIREILKEAGITATVGIGTNLYLAKVCMDITAKKSPPDKDGVRIAELNESSYCYRLWSHRPLTDFWMVGPGKARRLEKNFLYTMGDIAERSQYDEDFFYKEFGIDGEILIAHAWGIDPVTMKDIKGYHVKGHSLSNGQVLWRPYKYSEARIVFSEMIDRLCSDMFRHSSVAGKFSWWVSYDWKSLEEFPDYEGEVCIDFYGRLHPKHSNGTVRMPIETNSTAIARPLLLAAFDTRTDHRLLYRRLGIAAEGVREDYGFCQMDLFIDYEALEREKRLQGALSEIRSRYGPNGIFTGKNLLKSATQLERNSQVGGHKA